jgi:hypothetical protein
MSRDERSSYYDAGGIEVLDIIRAKLTATEYKGFLKGNAIKYLCRSSFKGDELRDLEKARNYGEWLHQAEQEDRRGLEKLPGSEEMAE